MPLVVKHVRSPLPGLSHTATVLLAELLTACGEDMAPHCQVGERCAVRGAARLVWRMDRSAREQALVPGADTRPLPPLPPPVHRQDRRNPDESVVLQLLLKAQPGSGAKSFVQDGAMLALRCVQGVPQWHSASGRGRPPPARQRHGHHNLGCCA